MKEKGLLEKLILLLSSEHSVRERYDATIAILKVQLEQAKKDRYRIGVIGVTSSGKSTMINSILGEKLLCMEVRPSSSQLVTCSKKSTRQACVYFENDRCVTLLGDELNHDVISRYSNENMNRNNIEKVKQLELSTPGFAFPDDILLVGSPGLDAYGLEGHERITMNNLLPTIDFCIFVTTLKTQSDQKMLDVLNVIAEKGCPVIVVQNMLDSVKPSADGRKSIAEVAQEHRQRAERIVNRSDISDKNSVRIVQISSIQALEGRVKNDHALLVQSNYQKLVDAVCDALDEVRPRIESNRMKDIKRLIEKLISDAESDISADINSPLPEFEFNGLDKELNDGLKVIKNSLSKTVIKLGEQADFVNKHKTVNMNPMDWITALIGYNVQNQNPLFGGLIAVVEKEFISMSKTIWGRNKFTETNVEDIKNLVGKCEESLLRQMKEYSSAISKVCRQMGVDERRLKALDSFGSLPELKIHTKTVKRRVEKTGGPFGGNVARWFANLFDTDWGYTYKDVTEYDEDKTRESAVEYIGRAVKMYTQSCERWITSAEKENEVILSHIELKRKEYTARREKALDVQKQKEVIEALKGVLSEIPEYKSDNAKKITSGSTDLCLSLSEIEIHESVYSMYKLADIVKRKMHQTVFQMAFPDNGRIDLVLSWDAASAARFLKNSFGIIVSDEETSGTFHKGNVLYIFEPDRRKLESISDELRGKRIDCLVMFDALQYGAAMKTLKISEISGLLNSYAHIGWAVQDMGELRNAGEGSVRDGIRNMLSINQEFGISAPYSILLSDENPVYNLAALQVQSSGKKLHADELDLIGDIRKAFPYLMNKGSDRIIHEIFVALTKED